MIASLFISPLRQLDGKAAAGIALQHRNKGLGRWIKAGMLDKVLKDHPRVKVVRTGNADSNAPMLKINRELDFKPYMAYWTRKST